MTCIQLFLYVYISLYSLTDWLVLTTCQREFHIINKALNWTEAQTYCRQKFTDQATIENDEEISKYRDKTLADSWIGLLSKINWMWSDGLTGSGAEYRNWETSDDEPDFISASQYCVLIGDNGKWWDYDCKTEFPFICYKGKTYCVSF
uniref:C-type lectin domain-containing protein n=1 Tax=Kryptolebias marmoratus TaxID=37003 RepID=A0A3Q2ZKQ8_KRYMA